MSNLPTVIFLQKPNNFETKYLIGNPDITFFKSVYRRYTNFSKFTTSISPTESTNSFQYKISNFAGDLLSKVYLENNITFNGSTVIYNNLGTSCFNEINIKFNNNITIFRNDNLYLEARSELNNDTVFTNIGNFTTSPYLTINASNIVCINGNKYQNTTLSGGVGGMKTLPTFTATANFFIIPDFSFMKDYGLSIPLLCLNNTDIYFNCLFNKNSISDVAPSKYEQKCIVEYINLDLAEKKRFKLNDHEYIIEDTTKLPFLLTNTTPININDSDSILKQLLFVGGNDLNLNNKEHNTPKEISDNSNIRLTLDNELFIDNITSNMLTRYNVYQHYKGSGREAYNTCNTPSDNYGLIDSIGVVSFCLYPNNYTQPSGSVSISNNKNLAVNLYSNDQNTNTLNNIIVYKISYNILKISNGEAQLYMV